MMAVYPGRKPKRGRFAVVDLVVLIAGVALILSLPLFPEFSPLRFIENWNRIDEWAGNEAMAERWTQVAGLVAEIIARACLAMVPLMLWRSARLGRTLRAAELLMVAIAAPLLVEPASRTGWLDYRYNDDFREQEPEEAYATWRGTFEEFNTLQRMPYGSPTPRLRWNGSYMLIVAPTPGHQRILFGIEAVAILALALRISIRRHLQPWMASVLMVTVLFGSTPWLIDPLTCRLANWLMHKGVWHSPWSEGSWRLVDASNAVIPSILTIAAIRDFFRDWRGRLATEWLGLSLAAILFVACEMIQFHHIFEGGEYMHGSEGVNAFGPAIPTDLSSILLALFLLVPLTSCLLALLIHATLGPIWRRCIGSGPDASSAT